MNINGRLERVERSVPPVERHAACAECDVLRRGISRVYGVEVEPFSCAPGAHEDLHRNILKVYGAAMATDLKRRLERAEAAHGAVGCPCQTPRLIEIVDVPAGGSAEVSGPCTSCCSPAPVHRIEAVRPEGCRP